MDRPAYTVQAETGPRPAPAHAGGVRR
jgi:hypothetical protein